MKKGGLIKGISVRRCLARDKGGISSFDSALEAWKAKHIETKNKRARSRTLNISHRIEAEKPM